MQNIIEVIKNVEIINPKSKTLVDAILEKISGPIFSIKLNQNEVNYVINLIRIEPEVFTKIQSHVDNIMADGVVNCHDIPEIISLVSEIYHSHIITNIIEDV